MSKKTPGLFNHICWIMFILTDLVLLGVIIYKLIDILNDYLKGNKDEVAKTERTFLGFIPTTLTKKQTNPLSVGIALVLMIITQSLYWQQHKSIYGKQPFTQYIKHIFK
jgi:hypothetical protein